MADPLSIILAVLPSLISLSETLIEVNSSNKTDKDFVDSKKALEQLQNNVDRLKAAIADSAEKKWKSESFKTWEKEARDVICRAEDAIDFALTKQALKNSRHGIRNVIPQVSSNLKETLLAISADFEAVTNNLKSLPISSCTADQHAIIVPDHFRMREPLREKLNVGLDDETKVLINMLEERKLGIEAICIVGMPGLGKTTMASRLFYIMNRKVNKCIWVNVSQKYSMRVIAVKILNQLLSVKKDWSKDDDEDLFEKVREYLKKVRFLLVMDDVWAEDAWREIRNKLIPKNGAEGKVLITSRSNGVAKTANPQRDPYKLRLMNDDESWKLLRLEVYDGQEGKWPQHLKEVGENIAKKCKGLPLAVVVTGGILKVKMDPAACMEKEWRKVSEGVAIEDAKNEKGMNIKNIVALSYDVMPRYLKECFLYLSVFPEDYEIPVWELTRIWIAEGFIQQHPEKDRSLEDIAEENLKHLIRINLVMLGERSAQGEAKTCRVHDIIRDFCKKEARETGLVQEVKKIEGTFRPPISCIGKCRRLCIHSSLLDFIREKPDGPNVRSFLYFTKEEGNTEVPLNFSPLIFKAFKPIRVFEGSSIRFQRFFPELGQLILSRYISFGAGDSFNVLPRAISELWNLQTLVIKTSPSCNTFTFDVDISHSRLGRLRHLKTKAGVFFKKGEKNGKANINLQTLDRLSAKSCTVGVLSNAPNLKTLGIRGDLADIDAKCLVDLVCLHKLKMIHDGEPLNDFLAASSFPKNLESLTLSGTQLNWFYMSTLGKLSSLRILKLKENAFQGNIWEVSDAVVYSIQYLHIEYCDLETWAISDDSFPKLHTIVLKNCEKLCGISRCLPKALKALKMEGVSNDAVSCALAVSSSSSINGLKIEIHPSDVKRFEDERAKQSTMV